MRNVWQSYLRVKFLYWSCLVWSRSVFLVFIKLKCARRIGKVGKQICGANKLQYIYQADLKDWQAPASSQTNGEDIQATADGNATADGMDAEAEVRMEASTEKKTYTEIEVEAETDTMWARCPDTDTQIKLSI